MTLVSAGATLKGQSNAKALGIGLSPKGTPPGKLFCIYWDDGENPLPTRRDNTNGTAGAMPYGNGKTVAGKDVFEDFFAQVPCALGAEATAILAQVRNARYETSLGQIKAALGSQGISLDVRTSGADEAQMFAGLADANGFAAAVHRYAGSAPSSGGSETPPDRNPHPNDPQREDERQSWTRQKEDLENQLARSENAAYFAWIMVALLAIIIVAVLAYLLYDLRVKAAAKREALLKPTQPGAGDNGALMDILQKSRSQFERVAPEYRALIQPKQPQGPKGKSYDEMIRNLISSSNQCSTEHKHKLLSHLNRMREGLGELLGQCDQLYRQTQNVQPAGAPTRTGETQAGVISGDAEPPTGAQTVGPNIGPPQAELTTAIEKMHAVLMSGFDRLKDGQTKQQAMLQQITGQVAGASDIREGLRHCWSLLRDEPFDEANSRQLFVEINKALQFCQQLSRQLGREGRDLSEMLSDITSLRTHLEVIRHQYLSETVNKFASPEQIVLALKIKLQDDAGTLKRLKEMSASFDGEDVFQAIPRLLNEQKNSLTALKEYVNPASSLAEAVRKVGEQYTAIAGRVREVLPEAQGPVAERVQQLAAGYLDQKERRTRAEAERMDARALAKEVAAQLHFNADHLGRATDPIDLLRRHLSREKQTDVYQQLRMGLSAALITLQKAQQIDQAAEQRMVIDALYVEAVQEGLTRLLDEMEKYLDDEESPTNGNSGSPSSSSPTEDSARKRYKDRLWEKGLYKALNDQWLHFLFRADLLLRTYFPQRPDMVFLQEAVSLAGSATRVALYELGVEVMRIELFEPLPEGMPNDSVYSALRELPAVREKILKELRHHSGFIIDVTAFPIRVNGKPLNPGRAVPVNPSTWLQN
ncbi:MAG TPA: hypothetical protein VJ464_17585 [Blastocatellia bacterium]|nr:hypothetical protein [Blastocatellia bacterium]